VATLSRWNIDSKMMSPLTERELGPRALDYLKRMLSAGKALSKHILTTSELGQGRIVTFLPSDITTEEANKFTTGGKLPAESPNQVTFRRGEHAIPFSASRVPNVDSWLIRTIKACLENEGDSLCLFENALAAAGDRWLDQSAIGTWICNRDVYHFVTQTDARDEKLLDATVRGAKSVYPPLIGAVTRYPSVAQLPPHGGTVTDALLEDMATRSIKVFVSAYDGEGYLIWTKSKGS
jgi:hypothetical protein